MSLARGWWVGVGWMVAAFLNTYVVLGHEMNGLASVVLDSTPTLSDSPDAGGGSGGGSGGGGGGGSGGGGERHGAGLCCGRHQKLAAIGFGVSGEVVQLDVGHCRKSCKRAHMESGSLREPASFETASQETVLSPCPSQHSCSAAESRLQRVSTLHGVQQVQVVHRCECHEKPAHCKRLPHQLVVNPGTPYETTIDAGTCGGHCATGTGCRALRNKTMSVAGPNGDQCHSVVAECGCFTSCYRASFMEAVVDYTSETSEHNATIAPLIKEVDIGKCVGSCAGDSTRKCVFRDRADPSRCLAGLYSGRRSECAPAQFAVHRYLTREREAREILAITDCKCA